MPPRAQHSSGLAPRRTYRAKRRHGRLWAAAAGLAGLVAVAVVLLSSGGSCSPAPTTAPLRRITVGTGATIVLRGSPAERRRVVVLLHGWKLLGPEAYRRWSEHLARLGSIVILPRYQTATAQDTSAVLANAKVGIRAALDRLRLRPSSLVVAGHSAGAALAADYAATAADAGLPAPAAVFAVYPGRAIRDNPPIPESDASLIAADTRIVVLAGASDDVVGEGPARELVAAATGVQPERRDFVVVDAPGADKHFDPVLDGRPVRREIWRRLDRLVTAASRERPSG